jgi:ribonuclease-3
MPQKSENSAGEIRAEGQMEKLQQLLAYKFRDPQLLLSAVTHSSLAYERAQERSADIDGSAGGNAPSTIDRGNEQLEFLGDAVLGMVVAEWLYRRLGTDDEGRLTRLRAGLVSRRNLSRVAARMGLSDYLLLGRGEERSGGRHKAAVLADALEAVIAAVYLDGGLKEATQLVERAVIDGAQLAEIEDWKSALQEWLQSHHRGRAIYAPVAESGPDHEKKFTVELRLGSDVLSQSTARSKKEAEQECARLALEKLQAAAGTAR